MNFWWGFPNEGMGAKFCWPTVFPIFKENQMNKQFFASGEVADEVGLSRWKFDPRGAW